MLPWICSHANGLLQVFHGHCPISALFQILLVVFLCEVCYLNITEGSKLFDLFMKAGLVLFNSTAMVVLNIQVGMGLAVLLSITTLSFKVPILLYNCAKR